jgi:hypothetical protein
VRLNINVYARGENKMYKTDITLVGGTSLEVFDNVNIVFDILSFNSYHILPSNHKNRSTFIAQNDDLNPKLLLVSFTTTVCRLKI